MTGNLTSWIKQYFSGEESTVGVLRSNSGRPEKEYLVSWSINHDVGNACKMLKVNKCSPWSLYCSKMPNTSQTITRLENPCVGTGDVFLPSSQKPVMLYWRISYVETRLENPCVVTCGSSLNQMKFYTSVLQLFLSGGDCQKVKSPTLRNTRRCLVPESQLS